MRLTQQAFAARLGLSITAVQNYERDRSPDLTVLAKLIRLADEVSASKLAAEFRGHARDRWEGTYIPAVLQGKLPYTSERELLYLRSVQIILADDRFKSLRKDLDAVIAPVVAHLTQLGSERPEQSSTLKARSKAFDPKGSSDERNNNPKAKKKR